MPTAARQPQKAKPIAWQQLQRWFQVGNNPEDWKRAHLDARFLTIPPSIEGVLEALAVGPTDQQQVVSLAARAVGTYDEEYPLFRRDIHRTLMVCDWALRNALAFWLDKVPVWCFARPAGDRLRRLQPILSIHQIIEALMALSPIWIALGAAARDRGTGEERRTLYTVESKASQILQALALVLPRALRLGADGDHSWVCYMAMRVLRGRHDELDPVIRAGVPALVGVLCDVRAGDSTSSMIGRCVWSTVAQVDKGASRAAVPETAGKAGAR